MKVFQQFHAQKRNPNTKHNNRSTLLTREKEKSKLSIIYDDSNKDDHNNKQQTFEEEIRKLASPLHVLSNSFQTLSWSCSYLKDNIMTNGRYFITINTVKSPFAAALATLMGADMLKHLLARLPNPIFFRVGIQPQGEHVIGLASEMGSPVFLFSYLNPPPKYEHAHKMCLCVCVCGGGG